MAKSPKAFDRLYVNMIKAGEAGGALEIIFRRLAEFQERSLSLKRKIKGAMVYPVVVVLVAVGILTFIMIKIVPTFDENLRGLRASNCPPMTVMLINISHACVNYWWAIPGHPVSIWLIVKLIAQVQERPHGLGPVHAQDADLRPVGRKEHPGPHHAHPGHAGLQRRADPGSTEHHPRNGRQRRCSSTCSARSRESIREGESIAKPMKEFSKCKFQPCRRLLLVLLLAGPIGLLIYLTRMNAQVVDDLVVNMVDVGEETGELDTMLYKVADTYDEEVAVLTESLMSLMEPLLDHLPGRGGRLHRHRAVLAAGQVDRRIEPLRSPGNPRRGRGNRCRSTGRWRNERN